jgi:hypothetical protein
MMSAQGPVPLQGNPGNVFLEGQDVSVPLPDGGAWRAFDAENKVVAQGQDSGGRANLGKLGIGFYRVRSSGAPSDVLLAVIAPLVSRTPADSPIGVDAGRPGIIMSSSDQLRTLANLMSLAGASWVRVRFRWRLVQPEKGGALAQTRSDEEARIFHDAGLHVLELMEAIPDWTPHQQRHLPDDLRDAYTFYRDLAKRWAGTGDSIEPWNEGDVHMSAAEMASYQKATYLGLKAGDPHMIVASNAFSSAMNPDELREFGENDAMAYADTLNFHHYQPVAQLPEMYTHWRSVADGKPLWVDELNLRPPRAIDPATHDPAPEAMLAHTPIVAKVLATSLFLNAQKSFYFYFGDFTDNAQQFGALRSDLTPRPDYVALAAAGRFLVGAKPIAAWQGSEQENPAVYAFRALPDGTPRDVLVAWGGNKDFKLPVNPVAIYDHFGRRMTSARLSEAPIFIVLPAGTVQNWVSGRFPTPSPKVEAPPPATSQPRNSGVSPIVLQALFRDEQLVRAHRAVGPIEVSGATERMESAADQQIQLFAYNFSNKTVQATINAQASNGWAPQPASSQVTLPPMGRVPIKFSLQPTSGGQGNAAMVKVRASVAQMPDSVLAFQVAQ